MRFGCCTNLLAQDPQKTGLHAVEAIASAGYDYVELPISEIMALSDKKLGQALDMLDDLGLHCEVCNNLFPRTMQIIGNHKDMAPVQNHLISALKTASFMGTSVIVFGSGASKKLTPNIGKDAAYAQIVEMLSNAAPIANILGITIVVEPQVKIESDITNLYSEACQLAKDVNHPSVKTLVDYYHFTGEQEAIEALVAGGEMLTHIHFAQYQNCTLPKRTYQEAGYAPFFKALKSIGYDSRISIEAHSNEMEQDIQEAILFLHEWCENLYV